MKKLFLLSMSLFFFVANARGFADENQRLLDHPSRIYLGPEFLFFQANTNVKDIHVDGHRVFWGLRFGYEYLKPQAFYAAAEILAANAAHNFSISDATLFYRGKGGAGFGSLQSRFGYTLSAKQWLMTPYLGLGIYSLSKYGHHGFEEGMGYFAGGLRTQLECTSICSIGLNAEVFRSLGFKKKAHLGSEKTTDQTNGFGCNIGAPITVHLSRSWDTQLIPYYLRLLFSESQNIYGTTLLFGYRF